MHMTDQRNGKRSNPSFASPTHSGDRKGCASNLHGSTKASRHICCAGPPPAHTCGWWRVPCARPNTCVRHCITSLPDPQVVEGLTDCDTPEVPSRPQTQHEQLPQHSMPTVPATIGRELEFVSSQLCSQQLQSPLPDGAPHVLMPDGSAYRALMCVACGQPTNCERNFIKPLWPVLLDGQACHGAAHLLRNTLR